MDLFVSSGSHYGTNVGGRIQEINENTEKIDVVFIERSDDEIGIRNQILLTLYAPLSFGFTVILLKTFRVLIGRYSSDTEIVGKLEEKYDPDIIHVDIPHSVLMYKNRRAWALTNWFAILYPLILSFYYSDQISVLPTVNNGVILFWVFIPLLVLITYLSSTLPFRDSYMVDNMEKNAVDYDEGCLITGARHSPGVVRRVKESKQISLVE